MPPGAWAEQEGLERQIGRTGGRDIAAAWLRDIGGRNNEPTEGQQTGQARGLPHGRPGEASIPAGGQEPFSSSGVTSQCICPFGRGVLGGQIVRREDGNRATGGLECLVHLHEKVAPWSNIPCLDKSGVTCRFQAPGDPLGPTLVGMVVTDKEVAEDALAASSAKAG